MDECWRPLREDVSLAEAKMSILRLSGTSGPLSRDGFRIWQINPMATVRAC